MRLKRRIKKDHFVYRQYIVLLTVTLSHWCKQKTTTLPAILSNWQFISIGNRKWLTFTIATLTVQLSNLTFPIVSNWQFSFLAYCKNVVILIFHNDSHWHWNRHFYKKLNVPLNNIKLTVFSTDIFQKMLSPWHYTIDIDICIVNFSQNL